MRYRSKPVEVTAIQVAHGNMAKIEAMLGKDALKRDDPVEDENDVSDTIGESGPWLALTLGKLKAVHGDFLLIGPTGDLGVISPQELAANFDAA